MTQTVILRQHNRALAHRLIDAAPDGHVCKVSAPARTSEQNDKMWAMLSDVSRAKPHGRVLIPAHWKGLFMDMCGHKPIWEPSLDGDGVVNLGYKSSRLNKAQFSELIEAIAAYGAEHGVQWSDGQ
jgi:hypothetical protein